MEKIPSLPVTGLMDARGFDFQGGEESFSSFFYLLQPLSTPAPSGHLQFFGPDLPPPQSPPYFSSFGDSSRIPLVTLFFILPPRQVPPSFTGYSPSFSSLSSSTPPHIFSLGAYLRPVQDRDYLPFLLAGVPPAATPKVLPHMPLAGLEGPSGTRLKRKSR